MSSRNVGDMLATSSAVDIATGIGCADAGVPGDAMSVVALQLVDIQAELSRGSVTCVRPSPTVVMTWLGKSFDSF